MPVAAARFSITIDGYEIASFSELSGIARQGVDLQVSSGSETILQALAGRSGRLTFALSRPRTPDLKILVWHRSAVGGSVSSARKNVCIILHAYDGKPMARYSMQNAWPSKIEIGSLKAGASEVLMETVTLVCDSIQRVG